MSVLVSILMTSYNREKFIAEAIESVLASTYNDFELIIVDDCSVDNTVSIANEYAKMDKRVRLFVNEKNLGDYPNRNKAASYAKGKYIKYCDSDDKLFNWTIDYCVQLMEKYPDAGMGILNLNRDIKEEYMTPEKAILTNFYHRSILNIGPPGTILKKEAFDAIGCFRPDYGTASDMYFNIKMASAFPIVLLERVFFFYRNHDGQELKNTYSYVCNNYKYLNDALDIPGLQLSDQNKRQLLKKAKRSFVKDWLIYLIKTKNVSKSWGAIRLSGIGFTGFLKGIFQ